MKVQRIAVIGAGPAGLSAAKHLIGRGFDVTVYEKGSEVGGLWVYDNDNGIGAAYQSLRINSEAKDTGYRDFPIPAEASLFPTHYEMRLTSTPTPTTSVCVSTSLSTPRSTASSR